MVLWFRQLDRGGGIMKNNKKRRDEDREEKDSEDWCFVCKDGGLLMICDDESCLKVYHPRCIGKKRPSMHSGKRWICCRHSCSLCNSTPRYYCLCCPVALCGDCIGSFKFALLREENRNGLCKSCLKLIISAEENYDSDGAKKEVESLELFLFLDYWEIVRKKEGLNFDDIYSADNKLKEEERQNLTFGSVKAGDSDENVGMTASDSEDVDLMTSDSDDVDLTTSDSDDVHLTTSDSDDVDLTTSDSDSSSDDTDTDCEDGDEDKNKSKAPECKKRRMSSGTITTDGRKLKSSIQKSCFAAIVVENMNLVYIRKSLLEELLKEPDHSESKILGSFVRVKNDPPNYLQENTHQLSEVKGIIEKPKTGVDNEIFLQVSYFTGDIPLSRISDDKFTKEECEELRKNVENRLLRKPTVVELEQKARELHEVITKHWIKRELVLLQKLIDRTNEKGQRVLLNQHVEKRTLLEKQSEQERLLKNLPEVIAEDIEPESASLWLSLATAVGK